jgi:hypothetical protein
LSTLPKSFLSVTPLIEELAQKDGVHDDSILTMLNSLEAVQKSPRASASLKKTAKEIIDTLKLSPSDTAVSYPQEAINAKNREEIVAKLKGSLQLFTLPEGGTLYDIAQDYLAAARDIDALLSERTKLENMSETDRREVPLLRVQIIAEIGRCRAALADELKTNPNLPNNVDAQIFGYFDDLNQTRSASHQASRENESKQEAEAKAKAAKEAKESSLLSQLHALEKTREAEEAQRLAQEAKDKSNS